MTTVGSRPLGARPPEPPAPAETPRQRHQPSPWRTPLIIAGMLACVALARSCYGGDPAGQPDQADAPTDTTTDPVDEPIDPDQGTGPDPTTSQPSTTEADDQPAELSDDQSEVLERVLQDVLADVDNRISETNPARSDPEPPTTIDPTLLEVFPEAPDRGADNVTIATWLATMVLSADVDGEAPYSAIEPFLTPELALEIALASSGLDATSDPPPPIRVVGETTATVLEPAATGDIRIEIRAVLDKYHADGATTSEVAIVDVYLTESDGLWTATRIRLL